MSAEQAEFAKLRRPAAAISIGLNMPADAHYGFAEAKAVGRAATLANAREKNPECFNTRKDPKILAAHMEAWTNNPAEKQHSN